MLKDLSTSILSFFSPDTSPYAQCIATELCSLGFEIWQNYIDAMALLRLLFGLATGLQASTKNELRTLAKTAVLHVAGVNTPLFMTTLLFDISNPSDVVHRNATMKLLGFMVRKVSSILPYTGTALISSESSETSRPLHESTSTSRSSRQVPRSDCYIPPREYPSSSDRDPQRARPNVRPSPSLHHPPLIINPCTGTPRSPSTVAHSDSLWVHTKERR